MTKSLVRASIWSFGNLDIDSSFVPSSLDIFSGSPLARARKFQYATDMTTTVDATYANGKIILSQPLSLPENAPIRVTIETEDSERGAWLKSSEQSLMKTWDNPGDDVFNELLSK